MFIFIHIPKTAGTTFNDFLYNNILPKNWIWITGPLEFSFISDKGLNGFDYIATHAEYGFFNRITVDTSAGSGWLNRSAIGAIN